MVPIVMKTLPTECISEQLPHLELGHSDASQDLRRREKKSLSTSWDKKTKMRGALPGNLHHPSWKSHPKHEEM